MKIFIKHNNTEVSLDEHEEGDTAKIKWNLIEIEKLIQLMMAQIIKIRDSENRKLEEKS